MLKHRIVSGTLILSGSILCVFFLPPVGLLIAGSILIAMAQREFYGLLKAGGRASVPMLGIPLGLAYIGLIYYSVHAGADDPGRVLALGWLLLTVVVVVTLLGHLFSPRCERPVESVANTLLGIAYVPVLMVFMALIGFNWADPVGPTTTGRLLLLYMVSVVKFGDIGAFTVGMAIGKHKMIPRISPAKSWEGFGGGILFSVLIGVLFRALCGPALADVLPWRHVVPLGILLSVMGVVGDLTESMIKRAVGVKDSGRTIPGMGGLLDVLDSLILAGPVMYLYLVWVAA